MVIYNRLKKRNLQIHIGHFRTGSSSMQSFFYENRNLLAQSGILYPTTFLFNNAHHLLPTSIFVKVVGDKINWVIPDDIIQEYVTNFDSKVDDLLREIELSKEKIILLSSELFCDFLHYLVRINKKENELLRAFNELILKLSKLCNVEVLIFLRSHDEYLFSIYYQILKSGTFLLLTDFINVEAIHHTCHFYFSDIIKFFESSKIQSIHVKKYRKNSNSITSFFEYINKRYGLSFNLTNKVYYIKNISFSLDKTNILLFINFLTSFYKNKMYEFSLDPIYEFYDILYSSYHGSNIDRVIEILREIISADLAVLKKDYNFYFDKDLPCIITEIEKKLNVLRTSIPPFDVLFDLYTKIRMNFLLSYGVV